MQKVLLIIMFSPLLCFAKKDTPLKMGTIDLFNKQVNIMIPADFQLMDDGRVSKVYPAEFKPKVAYSNSERTVRVGFGAESLGTKESGLPTITAKMEAILHQLRPKAKWKNEGINIIHGQKIGFIEYLNKKPEKFFELVFFTSYKGQLLSCQFRAPKKKHKGWKLVAYEIMQSFTIKK